MALQIAKSVPTDCEALLVTFPYPPWMTPRSLGDTAGPVVVALLQALRNR